MPQIGNAAYHNDLLYEELRSSIHQLTNLLLSPEEDKTKANAAGALSNLVRNSNKLCEDIVSIGAIQVYFITYMEIICFFSCSGFGWGIIARIDSRLKSLTDNTYRRIDSRLKIMNYNPNRINAALRVILLIDIITNREISHGSIQFL